MKWIPFPVDAEHLQSLLVIAVPRLVAAVVVFVLFWVALRVTQPAIRLALRRAHFVDGLIKLLVDGLYRGVIVVLGLAMVASQLGINVSALLAGVGVAGIALGFAAQETVANMIAGFLIFWDRPFTMGDYITTESWYGEVREITLRTTRIRTLDNTYVVIPNKQIIGDALTNHSMYGETRVVIPLGIAYRADIGQAREVLLAAVREIDGVMERPAPDVVARSFGVSSVNLEIRVWIPDGSGERPIAVRVVEACKAALDAAGIEIPFPHRQLIVEGVSDGVWSKAATLLAGARGG